MSCPRVRTAFWRRPVQCRQRSRETSLQPSAISVHQKSVFRGVFRPDRYRCGTLQQAVSRAPYGAFVQTHRSVSAQSQDVAQSRLWGRGWSQSAQSDSEASRAAPTPPVVVCSDGPRVARKTVFARPERWCPGFRGRWSARVCLGQVVGRVLRQLAGICLLQDVRGLASADVCGARVPFLESVQKIHRASLCWLPRSVDIHLAGFSEPLLCRLQYRRRYV